MKTVHLRKLKMNIPLLAMFLPVLAFYAIFRFAPMGGLVIAFKDYSFISGIWNSPWVGMENFKILFRTQDSLQIIRNTLVLSSLSLVVGFPVPIIIAILLNEVKQAFFKKSVQTLIYIPHFFSWVIVGGIALTLFSQQTGIINQIMKHWSLEPIPFLYQKSSWTAIFLGSGIWKEAGFNSIIYLASLTSINPELYEVAEIDGASKLRKIWNVTLPGIRSTIFVMLILAMGHIMEVGFDQVYVLQNAAVSNISEVISTYIYKVGIQKAQFSLTTALGFFDSLIAFLLVVLTNGIAKRFNHSLW